MQRLTRYAASARGESRTRTRLPSADFESAASAIPPLGLSRKFVRALLWSKAIGYSLSVFGSPARL